ncbi:unnamed protein product [Menidia menidia]|uniref:(Atlantic silverside) hypothetical protein n=1 Tax=Menidia menidia TaxID=238744 RepID=A0A8S4BZA3_9TELE|nr:unnamed protein product [Menidia menidia]
MDPNKTPSAPPMWSEEKASMVESPAPPPYEDHPYPGYPPPGPGYPVQPQGPGYPQQYAGAGYGQQPFPTAQPYPAQPGAVTAQPTLYMAQGPLQNPVNDYLGYSIFTMLCCCLPVGIAALIYSILVSLLHIGTKVGAHAF